MSVVGTRTRTHARPFVDAVMHMKPVGYWPLDDRSGFNPSQWYDRANGLHLTSGGNGPLPSIIPGDHGFAQVFNGGTTAGSINDTALLDVTNFTIMVHIQTTAGGGANNSGGLVSKGVSGTEAANPFQIRYNSAGTTLFMFVGNNTTSQAMQVGSASQFITGRTHQLFFTADGSNLRAYAAGAQVTSAAQTVTPYNSTGQFHVGRGFAYVGNSRMSHVALWARALSPGDIRSLYVAAMSPN